MVAVRRPITIRRLRVINRFWEATDGRAMGPYRMITVRATSPVFERRTTA